MYKLFTKFKTNELKELKLSFRGIKDIRFLEKVKFEKL